MTAVLAIGALILGAFAIADRNSALQQSRERSAQDTCQTLRAIVLASTPPNKTSEAFRFLNRLGLQNCVTYSHQITKLK